MYKMEQGRLLDVTYQPKSIQVHEGHQAFILVEDDKTATKIAKLHLVRWMKIPREISMAGVMFRGMDDPSGEGRVERIATLCDSSRCRTEVEVVEYFTFRL